MHFRCQANSRITKPTSANSFKLHQNVPSIRLNQFGKDKRKNIMSKLRDLDGRPRTESLGELERVFPRKIISFWCNFHTIFTRPTHHPNGTSTRITSTSKTRAIEAVIIAGDSEQWAAIRFFGSFRMANATKTKLANCVYSTTVERRENDSMRFRRIECDNWMIVCVMTFSN